MALSTNSVAASVEPVIQQQFFTLSPMNGQEPFAGAAGGLDARTAAHSILSDTPTTTSMLAALHDSFTAGGPLDTGAPDSYMTMGYVDTGAPHDEGMVGVGGMFGDYSTGTSFDVPTFTPQDLGLSTDASSVGPPSSRSSPEQKNEAVKDETSS